MPDYNDNGIPQVILLIHLSLAASHLLWTASLCAQKPYPKLPEPWHRMKEWISLLHCTRHTHTQHWLLWWYRADSQVSVLVRRMNAVWSALICFTLSASPLSCCNEISRSRNFCNSWHCSSSSSTLIGARYCCLNSGLASSVERFSFCPFSLACSNKSITSVARSQTRLGSVACDRIASRWVLDIFYWQRNHNRTHHHLEHKLFTHPSYKSRSHSIKVTIGVLYTLQWYI